jgi:hypothetical protein
LYEGSDVDIDEELEKLRATTNGIKNLSHELKTFLTLEYAPAKAVSYKVGTPRFFGFEFSESPMKTFDGEEIDGFVNLIFSSDEVKEEILEIKNEPILYAFFEETEEIKNQLFEIKVINQLFEKIDGKDPAKREVQNLKDFRTQQLRVYLLNALFQGTDAVSWYFDGEEVKINSRTAFNKFLSTVCEKIYHKTPVFRNELMNRHKLSGNISSARRNFLKRLIEHYQKEDLGFLDQEFPPEKAIYYALLKKSGIHQTGKMGIHYFGEPNENTDLQTLWDVSNQFLASATVSKKSIRDFMRLLAQKPYKLKGGFIEYWIPTFLFMKKEEIALYYEDRYLPHFNFEILDVLTRDANRYLIKTFAIDGVKLELFNKYRLLIQQDEKTEVAHTTFLSTIKPFIKFYKNLPNYTKNTDRVSDDAKAFRLAILKAKELEKTFFEDLPTSFGLSLSNLVSSETALSEYIRRLQLAMRELSSVYPNFVERIEEHLLEELGLKGLEFHEYKPKINKRYTTLKNYLLTPQQKVVKARLISPLDDREKYLNSVSAALIGKSLGELTDTDELRLHKKLLEAIRELDNLIEMANLVLDEEKEQAVQIEITKFQQSPVRHKIILTKKQSTKAATLKTKVNKVLLKQDTKVTQAVLIELLEEMLNQSNGE